MHLLLLSSLILSYLFRLLTLAHALEQYDRHFSENHPFLSISVRQPLQTSTPWHEIGSRIRCIYSERQLS